jgi:hypothetical protein
VILRHAKLPWTEHDLTDLPEPERSAEAERLRAAARDTPFDIAHPPLLRLTLLRLAPDHHRLLVGNHHILLDGWSTGLLVRELFALYAAAGGGTPAPLATAPYRTFLRWLAGRDRAAADAAWRAALDGLEAPTLLAPDAGSVVPAPPRETVVDLGAELTVRLEAAGRAAGITPSTLVQGAWALLLRQITGREDVVLGATLNGRPDELPGAERTSG